MLVQSPRKFLSVIWNLITKTYPEFLKLRSFFKISKKKLKTFFKINEFFRNEKKDMLPFNLLDNNFTTDLLITFQHCYYGGEMFLTSLIWFDFFRFFLYDKILKFRSNQTFG